jgi:HME family heavy-metal exporter
VAAILNRTAVVDVENIVRRLRQNRRLQSPRPVLEVITAASQEVRSSIVLATIIIVLVFVPLFALADVEGRLFTPLGIAYIVSIFSSLMVSITLTPVLSYFLLSGDKRAEHESYLLRFLKRGVKVLLDWAFVHRSTLIAAVALAALMAAIGTLLLPRSFLPRFNEGTVTAELAFNPGISLAESNRLGLIAERLVSEVPEVRSVGRRTGRAEYDEHAEGIHHHELDIDLARSSRSKEEIFADIRAAFSILPVSINIEQPIGHRLEHMRSGIRAEVVLKIFGDDLENCVSSPNLREHGSLQFQAWLICKSRSKSLFRRCASTSITNVQHFMEPPRQPLRMRSTPCPMAAGCRR